MVDTKKLIAETSVNFPFDPSEFPRELKDTIFQRRIDIEQMLSETDTLCWMICLNIFHGLGFSNGLDLPEELPTNVANKISALADKTNLKDSLSRTLPVWSVIRLLISSAN